MSDPLVQELREAATHAEETWLAEKWPCRLLERAADALDAAHQREAALREALEQIANTTTTVTGGVSGFARGVDIPVSVDGTKEFARRVLAERAGVRPQGEPR